MSTNDPMTQEQLDAIKERVNDATSGPWAPWLDQDGQRHMQGRLMVGVAAGVIPDGDTWVEGPDVSNPVAETYIPEDRAFIVHAREDIPALLAEVERLRARPTVADDMVERVARALCNMHSDPWTWDEDTEIRRDYWRKDARAALDAALNPGAGS